MSSKYTTTYSLDNEYNEAKLIMITKPETGLEIKYKLQLYLVTVGYILRY